MMLIVGAGMAGYRAVIAMRAAGYEGNVALLGEEALLPYDRPPLSKSAITEEGLPSPVLLMDEGIAASLNVDVRQNEQALHIDHRAKTVATARGMYGYNKLLLATGAKPRKLTCPGGEHALLLRNFEDAIELRHRFHPGKKVAIIGGGFIGLELASSANKRGCHVTLVEAQPRILMRGVPEQIAKIVHDRHVTAGVQLITGIGIASLDSNAVNLNDGRCIPADTIIAGIGAAPETKLAADTGLEIENGIACTEFLQTSNPDIYAAGDCCSFIHGGFANRRLRFEAWRNAQDQGNVAGENMLGANKPFKAIPWFWSDQFDLSLQITGMADMGPVTVARKPSTDSLILFHLADNGTLYGASGIGPGNSIARDIKIAEMMIARGISPAASQLEDPNVQLKALLKG
jgi:3-phenylpropionate/trans-cinnamate dioxygenase ferredoxin reductase component